jgi:hypothetical protein
VPSTTTSFFPTPGPPGPTTTTTKPPKHP